MFYELNEEGFHFRFCETTTNAVARTLEEGHVTEIRNGVWEFFPSVGIELVYVRAPDCFIEIDCRDSDEDDRSFGDGNAVDHVRDTCDAICDAHYSQLWRERRNLVG